MNTSSPPLLEAKGLAYATPTGERLAENLSFSLLPGKLVLITGPNGSGKSTLLRVLLGQLPASAGTVNLGIPIEKASAIPQMQGLEFHLPLTLGDLLAISLPAHVTEKEITALGLLDASQLSIAWNSASGGERQRALLTRALLENPDLLFLDEPLNHLDFDSQNRLLGAMDDFLARADSARGIVLVSHAALPEGKILPERVMPLDLGQYLAAERRKPC